MNLTELKQKRLETKKRAGAIIDKAEAEGRELTDEDRRDFDKVMDEIRYIDLEIETAKDEISDGPLVGLQRADGAFDNRMKEVKPGELRFLTREQKLTEHVTDTDRKYRDLDLARLVSLACGHTPKGDCSLERRALQEGSDTAGGFTVPAVVSRQIWDLARNKAAVMRAGATTVEMSSETIRIPKLSADPTGQWKVEGVEASADSTTAFEALQLVAHTLFFWVEISNELLQDAQNLNRFLSNAIGSAAALQIDLACLFGTGNLQPQGLYTDSDVNKTAAGAAGYWDDVSDSIYRVENANYTPDGLLMSPRTSNLLRKLKDGEGRYMVKPEWVPPVNTTKQISDVLGAGSDESVIFNGDWKHLLVGIRMPFRLEVLREAAAQKYMTVLMGAARLDACSIVASAFDVISGVTSAWA